MMIPLLPIVLLAAAASGGSSASSDRPPANAWTRYAGARGASGKRSDQPFFAAIPTESPVSPVCVEGLRRSDKCAVTAKGTAGSGEVHYLSTRAFFVNMPLDRATHASVITITQSGGSARSVSGSVSWTATDMAGLSHRKNRLVLRAGDSLLLTASGNGKNLDIDAYGNGALVHKGRPGDRFATTYGSPGDYTTTATIDGTAVGSVTISAVDVGLSKFISSEVGYKITESVSVRPALRTSDIAFTSSTPRLLEVSVKKTTRNGAKLSLRPLARGNPVLTARLGTDSGPVIAFREIDEYTMDIPAVKAIFFDAKGVGRTYVKMRPYVPNLWVVFRMEAPAASFAGGLRLLPVSTSISFVKEHDAATGETVGVYEFEVHIAPGAKSYRFVCNVYGGVTFEGIAGNLGASLRGAADMIRGQTPQPKAPLPADGSDAAGESDGREE